MRNWCLFALMGIFLFYASIIKANSTSQILVTKGLIYYDNGNLKKALEYFWKATEADPKDDEAIFYLGKTYLKVGNVKKGIHFLKRSNFPEAQFELGQYYFKHKDYRKAAKYFLSYAFEESDTTAYYYAGVAFFKLGKMKKSKRFFKISYSDPDLRAPSSIFLGLIYMKEKNINEAKDYFRTAIDVGSGEIKEKARNYLYELENLLHPSFTSSFNLAMGMEYDTNVFVIPQKDIAVAYGFPQEEINKPASADLYFEVQPAFEVSLSKNRRIKYGTSLNISQRLYLSTEAQQYNIFVSEWQNYLIWNKKDVSLLFPVNISYYYLNRDKQKYGNFWEVGTIYAKKKHNGDLLFGVKVGGEFYGYGNEKNTRTDRNGIKFQVIGGREFNAGKIFTFSVGSDMYYFYSLSSTDENDWKRIGFELLPAVELKTGMLNAGLGATLSYLLFLDNNYFSSVNGGSEYKRKDFYFQFTSYLQFSVARWSDLSFYYIFMNDSSNIDVFSYKRSIVGVKWGIVF